MAQIVYQILSGKPNFTVHLFPSGIAADQVKTELGEYTFDNVPPGYYMVVITDANGCTGVMEVDTGVVVTYDASFIGHTCKTAEPVTTTTTTKPVTTTSTTPPVTTSTTTIPVTTTTTTDCTNLVTLYGQVVYETASQVAVVWYASLSKPCSENPSLHIPITVTNSDNSGVVELDIMVYLNDLIGGVSVTYDKKVGAYNALITTFDALPTCYSGINNGSVPIPALGVTTTTSTTVPVTTTTTTKAATTTSTTTEHCVQVSLSSDNNSPATFTVLYCNHLTDLITVQPNLPQLHCVLQVYGNDSNSIIDYLTGCVSTTTTTLPPTTTTTTTTVAPVTTTTTTVPITTTTTTFATDCSPLYYNWYAVVDARNITSNGWHVPTNTEFSNLSTYLGAGAADKLKTIGTVYWNGTNVGATNEYGFNAKGVATRNQYGAFNPLGNSCIYWTSVSQSSTWAYWCPIYYNQSALSVGWDDKKWGCSVRLVKDSTLLINGQTGIYIGNDNKVYHTVCINNQEWLSEDLKETKYRDGSLITVVSDTTQWSNLTTEAICAYNNDWSNVCNNQYVPPTTTTSTTTTTVTTTTTTVLELPTVVTTVPSWISQNSARSGGTITTNGSYPIQTRGVCWSAKSTTAVPTVYNSTKASVLITNPYIIDFFGLYASTIYCVRAYIITTDGHIIYGQVEEFTTQVPDPPITTTTTSTTLLPTTTTTTTVPFGTLGNIVLNKIDQIDYHSARGKSTLVSAGSLPTYQRGLVWAKWLGIPYVVPVPTLSDNFSLDGTAGGVKLTGMTNLDAASQYEVRAYVTNSAGTFYSNQLSFQTLLPTIFVPDAFSPNGDGIHDLFQVYALEYYPNNEMSIFDQDGNTIYHSTAYHLISHMWNGKYNNTGALVPVGTYYYVLKVNGKTYKKSYVFVSY